MDLNDNLTSEEFAELLQLEAEFDAERGRGVELAERIDYLREKNGWDGSLACPSCGSDAELATSEELVGLAGLVKITADELDHEGYTDVDWDSSTTVGITCRSCGWDNDKAEDLREGLVPSYEARTIRDHE